MASRVEVLSNVLRRDFVERRRRVVEEFVELRELLQVIALRARRLARKYLTLVSLGGVLERDGCSDWLGPITSHRQLSPLLHRQRIVAAERDFPARVRAGVKVVIDAAVSLHARAHAAWQIQILGRSTSHGRQHYRVSLVLTMRGCQAGLF